MSPSPGRRPKASIVIRTFNEERHIGSLLTAIEAQSFQDFEIVLVDSGSTDRTLQIAKRHALKIESIDPQEFTFGRSLNRGIEAGWGEIIVIASAHVLPRDADWLAALLAPFEDQQLAMAYGKQRGAEGSQYSEDQHWRLWFPDKSDPDQTSNFSNNANSAVRRSIWQQQPFDEELTGLEDIAWSSWARQQGYKLAYVAEAEVAHLHDETPAQVINRYRREAIALKQILPQSRFTLWHFLSHFIGKSIADLRAALAEGLLAREFLNILNFRRRQYWGTYLGYRQNEALNHSDRLQFYYPPAALEPNRPEQNGEPLGDLQS